MLTKLPKKFEHFSGDSINIEYVQRDADVDEEEWENDMVTRELMLPCPKWALEVTLKYYSGICDL